LENTESRHAPKQVDHSADDHRQDYVNDGLSHRVLRLARAPGGRLYRNAQTGPWLVRLAPKALSIRAET
jgi:hypothetical protein